MPGRFAMALIGMAVCSAAQQHAPPRQPQAAVRVSAESPFPADCDASQPGRHFRNTAVEPWVAVDPKDPLHLIAVWQQDRWSNGGSSGLLAGVSLDGGRTWQQNAPAFSACSGGNSLYVRASDPWVTFSPDGTVYFIGLSLATSNSGDAVLVVRSTDGGFHWGDPVTLMQNQSRDVLDDKESITADPVDSKYVYAVWNRLVGLTATSANSFHGPVWFARTTDGGASWEAGRPIFDPGANAQTIGNQIVVLPDGTLVDLFLMLQNATAPLVRDERLTLAIIRSSDKGVTWSAPIPVSNPSPAGISDVKTGVPIRSAALIPSIAVDAASGALYVAWQDGRFSSGQREGIAFARSVDGGLTWSAPSQINQVPQVQAFNPAVAVGPNGEVAVAYYDFRKDVADPLVLLTSYWRVTSEDGGRSWSEAPVSEPFDLAGAPVTDGSGLFVGDYEGLVFAGGGFISLFVASGRGAIPAEIFSGTRASGVDRSHNGHTEVNRYLLRRTVERRKKAK